MSSNPGDERLNQSNRDGKNLKEGSVYSTQSLQDSSVVYTTFYSGTQVIEMTINGNPIMRRKNDSWFNATQILKISGLEKSKRTKILEREVQIGLHDKVQGGYGKFQGTWIPCDRAISLAQQYGVYEELKPLFLYNASNAEANDTPTKEQVLAAQRKKPLSESFNDLPKAGNSFYKAMSRQTSGLARTYSSLTDNDDTEVIDTPESPAKKQKLNPSGDSQSENLVEIFEHDSNIENPNTPFTLEPLSSYVPDAEHSKRIITEIFGIQDPKKLEKLADALGGESLISNLEWDVAIDEQGHTALHWAAYLAKVPLVKELIRRGAVRIRGDSMGKSPLVSAILVKNSFDKGSFGDLLDLLHPCIPLLDRQGRSILHHIALTAGIKERSSASRYYLETLLRWLVKSGPNLPNGAITLGKFMSEIVNAQDKNGDTCLNIATRIGNKAIIQQLLDVGADPFIPNKAGIKPVDFGINVSGLSATAPKIATSSNTGSNSAYNFNGSNGHSSQKILDSMQQLLQRLGSDFQTEMNTKQKVVDKLREQLKESTQRLSESRRKLDSLKQSDAKMNELRQKISNIDKAINEEEQKFIDQTTDLDSMRNFEGVFDPDHPFRISSIYEQFRTQTTLDPTKPIDSITIDPDTINPSELPRTVILKARIKAYEENENNLTKILAELGSNSANLENKFRRVVSLCTGVSEDKIDEILDGLVHAVESDPDEVDMNRVVGFLKKIDDRVDA